MHHLRIAGGREWSEFPERPEAGHLEVKFTAGANTAEQTLRLRQQDVKQTWFVRLNGADLGRLPTDENDMLVYFSIAPGVLKDGENVLTVQQDARRPKTDDVRIGQIVLDARPRAETLSEVQVVVEVLDEATGQRLPSRITVINADGALQSVGAASNDHLAVRPGTVYTADGRAQFGLPAGRYTLFAGRGFEYSLDSTSIELAAGQSKSIALKIRREVPTEGYVACDTHVHTLTHSGHGDATVEERMITLAAEGIELPIATDHNVHIDHEPFARKMRVRQYFTPVVGNEVTTPVGHFNIFPVQPGGPVPDYRGRDWAAIFQSIERTPDVKVVILNHARDLHSGTRPFGPKLHNSAAGANVEGWVLRARGMEVINSGAVQTDTLQLLKDWMTQLNHGRLITPVGGSDSHDVARHFVGQGRTYIRADDREPGAIRIDEAVQNFLQGRVMVSYGLLAELTVDGRYGPGELAPVPDDTVQLHLRVLGPHWVQATRLMLFANGKLIREEAIPAMSADHRTEPGVIWSGTWELPKPGHDVHLVAIAIGPGIDGLYWKTAKPYQPTSPNWTPAVMGCSGAVWLDVDEDGRRTPAIDYARRVVDTAGKDFRALLTGLAGYDEAVAIQAAHLWHTAGNSLSDDAANSALQEAHPHVRHGVQAYLSAVRECELARAEP